MSNPNAHESYSREVRQDSYQDANGNAHINVTRTSETVNNEDLTARDNDNAARGLLLGILLATLAALTGGAIWLYNQSNQDSTPVQPVVVPVPKENPEPKPPANNQPSKQTTIIEKIKEVPIPVAQPQAPSAAPQQKVDINIPTPAPAQPATPAKPEPTQAENQSTTEKTQTDNSNITSPQPVNNTDSESSEATPSDSSSSQ